MKKAFIALGFLVFAAGIHPLGAATIDELRALMLKVNPEKTELTLQFDPEKKILKVGRKIPVNSKRYVIQTQAVALKFLEPTATLDKIGSQFQPWIKLRCRNGRDEVFITEQVFVDDEEVELESTEEYHPVMVIPCGVYDLEEFASAVTAFLQSNR